MIDWLAADYEKSKEREILKAERKKIEADLGRELQWKKRREELARKRLKTVFRLFSVSRLAPFIFLSNRLSLSIELSQQQENKIEAPLLVCFFVCSWLGLGQLIASLID